MSIPYSISPGRSANLFVNGKFKTIPATHPNFEALVKALEAEEKDLDLITELADLATFIAKRTFGAVQISENKVRWNGKDVHGVIVDRILEHLKKGIDLIPLAKFLDRLMKNPGIDVRDDLFAWLESGNAPITPDGKFLAFKAVRRNYLDKHSGTMDNSVGKTVSMPREDVDDNRYNECSSGLHFCSHAYLASFYSSYSRDRVVVVCVDPEDVVAIPTDYNRQKGRAWKYDVIGEIEYEQAPTFYEGSPVVEIVTSNDDDVPTAPVRIDVGDLVEFINPVGVSWLSGERPYEVIGVDGDEDDLQITIKDDDGDSYTTDYSLLRLVKSAEAAEEDTDPVYAVDDLIVFNGDPQDEGFADLSELTIYKVIAVDNHDNSLYFLDDAGDAIWYDVGLFRHATEEEIDAAEKAKDEEVIVSDPSQRQFFSKKVGRSFLQSEILSLLKEHGQRGMERLTGVPRTTIQEWIKVIQG